MAMDDSSLVELAKKAAENSYSPYSGFSVGAALLCSDGTVYKGCNVENVSFSVCNCAERTAFFSAAADGKRLFEKIAVAAFRSGSEIIFTPPCGVCRQVMKEFCGEDFEILMTDGQNITKAKLGDLMPLAFDSF